MHYVKEFAKHFLLWTPVAIHIHTEYFRIDRVVGTSMQPTLNPSGSSSDDVVLCELLSGSYYWYQPGDVVLLRWLPAAWSALFRCIARSGKKSKQFLSFAAPLNIHRSTWSGGSLLSKGRPSSLLGKKESARYLR